MAKRAPAEAPSQAFARQLREIRESLGISQQKLADGLADFGVPMHQTAIAKIEKGERGVSLDDALAIAAVLGVSPTSMVIPRKRGARVAVAPNCIVDGTTARRWLKNVEHMGTPERPAKLEPFFDEMSEDEHRARYRGDFGHVVRLVLGAAGGLERAAADDNLPVAKSYLVDLVDEVSAELKKRFWKNVEDI